MPPDVTSESVDRFFETWYERHLTQKRALIWTCQLDSICNIGMVDIRPSEMEATLGQPYFSNMPQNIRFVEVIFQYELNSEVAVRTDLTRQSTDFLFTYSIALETVHSRCQSAS